VLFLDLRTRTSEAAVGALVGEKVDEALRVHGVHVPQQQRRFAARHQIAAVSEPAEKSQ
jgi:hypothetical protein